VALGSPDNREPERGSDDRRVTVAARSRTDLRLLPLADSVATRAAADLLGEIWQLTPPGTPISAEFLRALAHTDNYVYGAYDGDEMVGVSAGIRGIHVGQDCLHSQITGVVAMHRGQAVGTALKRHQQVWARERGLVTITWTFDPLVRRNAYFNLVKLGARPAEFLPNFYGAMSDGYNAGDESDRLLVAWPTNASAVRDGVRKHDGLRPRARLVRGDGETPTVQQVSDDWLTLEIPLDIHAMRRQAPDLALRWRRVFRAVLQDLLAADYRIASFDQSAGYLLRRPT